MAAGLGIKTSGWSAIYLPADGTGNHQFESRESAEKYVLDHMCQHCQEERQRALNGDDEASEHPGCFLEWLILPTHKAEQAGSLKELLEAAGFVTIYERDKRTDPY